MATLPESLTMAVIVMAAPAPPVGIDAALEYTSTLLAERAVVPPPELLSRGLVPGSPPPPPQAATSMATPAHAIACLRKCKCFISCCSKKIIEGQFDQK